ncbi:hypothetical protein JEQ21_07175 [Streptococcus sp. 121]|uniref:hypothetical protein n=1 Tax=Streptococcus sp. 121 TaxID=2797637 RepID=UPI0018F0856B|nr:hypothetical protein [Streptococcus sp. 121]MBJ6746237.1 hypothetical protein [Streptococcus sp. 121]
MKPIDFFRYCPGLAPEGDSGNLMVCYYPILGPEAFSLYHYLLAFWDGGAQPIQVSQVLNHLRMPITLFTQSLELLQVLRLAEVYKGEQYQIQLLPPLNRKEFLEDHLLSTLLEERIGEVALKELLPEKVLGQKQEVNLAKFFDGLLVQEEEIHRKPKTNQFDQEMFAMRMEKSQLRYQDRKKDVVDLELLARRYKLNWNELFLLAEETQVQGRISVKRIEAKLQEPTQKTKMTPEEAFYLKESKSQSALSFLSQLKDTRGTRVTDRERDLIHSLQNRGFLDEVISLLFLLAYNRNTGLHINEHYVLKVAGDFEEQGVVNAEAALDQIHQHMQEYTRTAPQKASQPKRRQASTVTQTNVPKWSQRDYVDQSTPEEKQAREEERQRLFQQMNGEGI